MYLKSTCNESKKYKCYTHTSTEESSGLNPMENTIHKK